LLQLPLRQVPLQHPTPLLLLLVVVLLLLVVVLL
jgi:hypothetical protein